MTPLEVHLAAFDAAWSHAWESLEGVLRDVSEAEAHWQAPAYALEAPEPDWPPPGTVRWHLAHLAHCKRYYATLILSRQLPDPPPARARVPPPNLGAERAELEAAQRDLRAAIAGIGTDDLSAPACGKMPLGEFLAMMIRHDAWHGGQVAVLRRLYRTRPQA